MFVSYNNIFFLKFSPNVKKILACSCNTDYSRGLGCNAQNGQCECLPGVIGEKCDNCPHRWVLIPDYGCQECDTCHHALLDYTDSLQQQIDPVIIDFNTIAGGYFTEQKLNFYGGLVKEYQPRVKILNPANINLSPLNKAMESLEEKVKEQNKTCYFDKTVSQSSNIRSGDLLAQARNFSDLSRVVSMTANQTIKEVKKLADSFTGSESSTVVDSALKEAQLILDELNKYQSDGNDTLKQLERAHDFLENVKFSTLPVSVQKAAVNDLKSKIGNFSDKLEDLHNWSTEVNEILGQTSKTHNKNKESPVYTKYNTLTDQTKEIAEHIKNSSNSGIESSLLLDNIHRNFGELGRLNLSLTIQNDLAEKVILPENEKKYEELQSMIESSERHADDLQISAGNLEKQLSNITANSEHALKAANAHSNIVDAVKSAHDTAKQANHAVGTATDLTKGVGDRAYIQDRDAKALLNEVREELRIVQEELEPMLKNSTGNVEDIKKMNTWSDSQTTAINL